MPSDLDRKLEEYQLLGLAYAVWTRPDGTVQLAQPLFLAANEIWEFDRNGNLTLI